MKCVCQIRVNTVVYYTETQIIRTNSTQAFVDAQQVSSTHTQLAL